MTVSKRSVALLLIQVGLVALLGAHYLVQRARSPRAWTRAAAYDPEAPMRGRYASLRLRVDACPASLEELSAVAAERNPGFEKRLFAATFAGDLKAEQGRLKVAGRPKGASSAGGQWGQGWAGDRCDELVLRQPVEFYLPEHVPDPTVLKPGQELWVEVTVPPAGPPRPVQLAIKENGQWRLLNLR